MTYSDIEIKKIDELKEQVELNRKEHRCATYRDSKNLYEILEIVMHHMTGDDLEMNFFLFDYLGRAFSEMGRDGLAASFYDALIDCGTKLGAEFLSDEKNVVTLRDAISYAAKLRNCYYGIEDDCEEIIDKAAPYIGEEKARELVREGKKRVMLVCDPIENTEDYLAVIDDIEEAVDKKFDCEYEMGMCFAIWDMKQKMLKEFGIEWSTPSQMNPHIMFD